MIHEHLAHESQSLEQSQSQKSPNTLRLLFRDILNSAKNGQERDLAKDMRDYLRLIGVTLEPEFQQIPDPSTPLVIAPNHPARSLFTTMESFAAVAATAVSADELNLTKNHTAWIIKNLDIHKVGPGIIARKVQNATQITYGTIPVRVTKKLHANGVLPKYKDTLANRDQLVTSIAQNVTSGNNIGFFPEQKPNSRLQRFHPNYPSFLNGLKLLAPEIQILPASIHYKGATAIVVFGNVIWMNRGSSTEYIANLTMRNIAANLPHHMRGHYA